MTNSRSGWCPRGLSVLFGIGAIALVLSACAGPDGGGAGLRAADLRTEYRVDPLGIGTPKPRLSWVLESEARGCIQSGYRILVADSERLLARGEGNLWDSGRVPSAETVNIVYAGSPLRSGQRGFWKVQVWDNKGRASPWSPQARFETALLDPADWEAAWISDGKPDPLEDEDFYLEDPAPLFRKSFVLDRKPAEARLYITGLGYYEARINGGRVGDFVLDPGWTDYRDRILFSTYDVTEEIRKGPNCLGVMLGNGWYNPLPLRMWGRLNLREHLPVGRPCFIARLELRFADGTVRSVVSGTSWRVHDGPLLRNNIFLGEVYDARLELPGWDLPGFEDPSWNAAVSVPCPGGRLEAQSQPPVRVLDEIRPTGISEPLPGTFIFDFGENFSGWTRLRVRGSSGTEIRLRYGELLRPDGALNPLTSVCGQIKGLRDDGTPRGGPGAPEIAVQQDVYVTKGGGEEVFSPTFTFHGFRFVEVTGYPGRPGPEALTGLRLCADVESAGSFECSDPLFNRIQDMTRRTFRSNLFSVQSDCPHRERFGYGGDLAVTGEAFMLNFDMAAFYAKAVRDWHDAATAGGLLTDTAPFVGIHYCGVAWAMVHPLLQSELYRYYGDRRLMEEQYPTSRRWLERVQTQYPEHIVSEGLSDHEGLEPSPAPPLVTPLYAEAARLVSRLAEILGLREDEARCRTLAQDIQETYRNNYWEPGTGRVQPHTQAGQAFALALDLLPQEERPLALEVLTRKIQEQHDGHISTGIFGTRFLLEALSRMGQAGLAASVVRQKGFPGWDYMLENGATTLWEHWAFSDNTFSHNHPMFGSVSAWFYRWLAGIQLQSEARGFDRFCIRPQPVPDLDWVEADYRSVRGWIRVRWERRDEEFVMEVTVPPNTRAEIFVPASDPQSIRERGQRPAQDSGVRFLRTNAGCAVFEIGSGTYTFTSILLQDEDLNTI